MSRPRPRRSNTIANPLQIVPTTNTNPDIFYTDDDIRPSHHQECRICLEPQSAQNRLIAPCRCTGSVQFIHEECIIRWIEKFREKRIDPVRCELCKEVIMYSLKNERSCNEWPEVREKISENYKIFLFLLFLFLINCGVTIYLIVLFVHIVRSSSEDPKFIEIGVISFSIVLLVVISSLLLGIMVREFVFSVRKRISGVLSQMGKDKQFVNLSDGGHTNSIGLNLSKAKIFPLTIGEIEESENNY